MRIFDCVQPWPHKVNFIDENNVVLGYDMKSSCCENFGWFISDVAFSQIPKNIAEIEDKYGTDYTGWLFDQNFIKDGDPGVSPDRHGLLHGHVVPESMPRQGSPGGNMQAGDFRSEESEGFVASQFISGEHEHATSELR